MNEIRATNAAAMPEVRDDASVSLSARAMARPAFLDELNPAQREAVTQLDGPVLVLAGAGTGKTRVLTSRIAHILETTRTPPGDILAVTFTNRAAREMKQRIGTLIGGQVEGMPWLGTFHAISARILRRHAELVDLTSSFTILDTDDQIRLLKQLLAAEDIDPKRWPARQLAGHIDGWKNRGLLPGKVKDGEAFVFADGRGAKLYALYQKRLKDLNAADFGDLLLECLRLLQENQSVLEEYQNRFRYMLVDEYQDTNVAQYLWLRLLAQGGGNICCVGDDDQSIYGWRGAEVGNILRFERDFPGATVVRLEENYRSTGHILGAASTLIAHNSERLGKTLHTSGEDGEKVKLQGCWDDEEEARTICEDIEQLQRQQHSLNEIAILVRASFQMRAFEARFVELGLPYRVIGGPRFYERQENRDAVAYFVAMLNPANDIKFERIINTPPRGLGKVTISILHTHARAHSIPLMHAARTLIETEEIGSAQRRTLADLLAHFDRWRAMVDTMPHTELAEIILDESGYTAMWQNDKSPKAEGRLDNLKELIRGMEDYDSLAGFLEHVTLMTDRDGDESADMINLMTLHSAKGLEFNAVFLPGWEDGLLPHQRSLDEAGSAGLEEERRLAHVGLTRAKRRAKITFARNRLTHGLWQPALPSRFIDELPEANVEVEEAANQNGAHGVSRFETTPSPFPGDYGTPGWQRARARKAEGAMPGGPPTLELRAHDTSAGGSSTFEVGERIFHQKFGYGSIARVDGNKLTVEFEKAGQKKVVDSFVERH